MNGLITVHLAPTQIIAALSVEFDDKLHTPAIEDLVERLEERVRAACPQVVALFHQAAETWALPGTALGSLWRTGAVAPQNEG